MEDQTTIKLKIPRQDFTGLPLFQPNTEAANHWVQSLPVTNTNSLMQLLDQALSDLNRTKLSPESRYRIIEILLPSVNVVLANLSKRFLNQPLIMAEEPRSMAERSARLLSMATTAYTIVGIEAIQQRDAIRETNPARLTCQAIQRALVFAGREVLQNFQLHRPVAIHNWQTLHQLYALADIQRLADLPVPEPLSGGSTIKATYLQALMLGCCKPNQLRQTDLMALYRGLQSWCDLIQLNNVGTGDDLFLVDLDGDQPPQYRALYREQPGPLCRTINTAPLLEHLKNLRQEMGIQGVSFDKNTSVLANVLDHVIVSLGSMSLRNFKRTRANSPLWICVGLSSVHYQVARQRLFEQMLYGDKYVAAATMLTQDSQFLSTGSKSDTWGKANPEQDYVRAGEEQVPGQIELDAATRARLLQEENPELPVSDRYPVYQVQLADTSPGGYCLDWVDELPGDIKTGDLVGLKEKEDQKEWVIAVIRWLSRLENAKTLIGLELFSPRAIAYGARIHLKGGEKTPPMRVLLLPEIRLMGQPQTLITPRAGFKERQTITLRNSVESRTIRLQRHITSTASFEQFEFRYIKELGDVLAEGLNGPAGMEYDSLWSNI
jgi:cyclic-di-GMP-binding protein